MTRQALAALGGALVLAGVLVAWTSAPRPLDAWRTFQGCLALIGAGALIGGLALGRGPRRLGGPALALVAGVAVLARLAWLPLEPNGDVYRYLWEGLIQLEGHNPYSLRPDAAELAPLRPDWWGKINHPDWPAIYGPLIELGLAGLVGVFGASVLAMKAALVACDLLGVALLWRVLRRLDRHEAWIVGYAWHPLVLWHIAGEAHLEAVVTPLLAGLLLALAADRDKTAGACAAGLVLVKATGLLLWPLLVVGRWRWQAVLVAPAALLLGYLPYADAGLDLFASLHRFGTAMRFNDLPTLLAGKDADPETLRRVAAAALLTTAALAWWRLESPARAGVWLGGVFLLVAPTVHPWYAIPLVACAVVVGPTPWWLLTATIVVAGETAAVERATGAWTEPAWTRPWVYYPVLAILACSLFLPRSDRCRPS